MKKTVLAASALALFCVSGPLNALAEVPIYDMTNTNVTVINEDNTPTGQPEVTDRSRIDTKIVGYVTYTFAEMDSEHPQRQVTASVVENKPIPDEEWLEAFIKNIYRAGQQGTVLHIDAINGVPIAQTKYAQYGGDIAVTMPYAGGRNPLGLPIKDSQGNVLYDGFFVQTDKMIGAEGFNKARAEAGYTGATPADPASTQQAPTKVTVVINNEPVYFPDALPFIVPEVGRTMVPMRAVFEHFWVQCTVLWNDRDKTVTAKSRDGRTVIFTIDDKVMTIIHNNGKIEKIENDVAPMIKDGRTYLPLRAMSEALTLKVDWSDNTYVVGIVGNELFNKTLLKRKDWGEYVSEYNKKNPF